MCSEIWCSVGYVSATARSQHHRGRTVYWVVHYGRSGIGILCLCGWCPYDHVCFNCIKYACLYHFLQLFKAFALGAIVDISKFTAGEHTVTLVADGAASRFSSKQAIEFIPHLFCCRYPLSSFQIDDLASATTFQPNVGHTHVVNEWLSYNQDLVCFQVTVSITFVNPSYVQENIVASSPNGFANLVSPVSYTAHKTCSDLIHYGNVSGQLRVRPRPCVWGRPVPRILLQPWRKRGMGLHSTHH